MEPGRLIDGRFLIEERIGAGGLGVVFRARDLDNADRMVAVKFLLQTSPRQLRRFHREFRALASLRHPHVVGAIAFGPSEYGPWLAMEHVDGRRMDVALRPGGGGGAPWEVVRRPLVQLLGTLADLHDRGFVHRDLKPSNILVDGDGHIRVLDFGLVRVDGGTDDATSVEAVVGTLRYMAPEQLDGRVADARSDLYAVGVIAYELLTGRSPYRARGLASLVLEHRAGPRYAPSAYQPAIPEALDAVVLRLLTRRPEDRFASAAEVLRALAAAGLVPSEAPEPFQRPPPSGPPLVPALGRRGELARLEDLARRVAAGVPRVVRVEGEPGIGRSFLLARALERLRRLGFATFGTPGLPPVPGPGGVFARAIPRLCEAMAAPGSPHAFGELVASLAAPGATEDGSGVHRPSAPATDVRSRRTSAFEGSVGLLRAVASARGPIAVVLDETEDADETSAALVEHWTSALGDPASARAPVLLLVGATSAEPVTPLHASSHVERLRLGPLTPFDLEGAFEGEPSLPMERARAAALLHQRTDGVPAVMRDEVEAWARRGWVRRGRAGLELTRRFHQEAGFSTDEREVEESEETTLGGSVSGSVQDVLETLPGPVRDLAARLAVLGPGTEFEHVAATAGTSVWAVLDGLHLLVARGVVDEQVDAGTTVYRLRAGRAAESLAASLDDDERADVHRQAAAWLLQDRGRRERNPARIARHLAAAGDRQAAAAWSLRAAEAARARQARDAALAAFEDGAEHARKAGDGAALVKALRGLCEECRALGRVERGLKAADELLAAAGGAGVDGEEVRAEAHLQRGTLLLLAGDPSAAAAALEGAITAAGAGARTAAEAKMRLAELEAKSGRLECAAEWLAEAAAAFAAAGDAYGESRARLNVALLRWTQGEFPEARRLLADLVEQVPEGVQRANARSGLGLVLFELGQPEEAIRLLDQAADEYLRLSDLPRHVTALADRFVIQAAGGSVDREGLDGLTATARRLGLTFILGWLNLARAIADGGEEGGSRGVAAARAAYHAFREVGSPVHAAIARMEVATGLLVRDPGLALRHVERALSSLPPTTPPTLLWQIYARAAEVGRQAGREEGSEAWAGRARSTLATVLSRYLADLGGIDDLDRRARMRHSLASIGEVFGWEELKQAAGL